MADSSVIPQAGSCVSIVVVRVEDGQKILYTANVGDSEIFLFTNDTQTKLTVDHHTDNEEEVKRIEDAGGECYYMGSGDDCLRVEGQINVTRTLGDYDLKSSGVITDPYVTRTVLTPEHTYVVVASDGLWDGIGALKASHILEDHPDSTKEQAEFLVKKALDEKSKDNISVFVIKL